MKEVVVGDRLRIKKELIPRTFIQTHRSTNTRVGLVGLGTAPTLVQDSGDEVSFIDSTGDGRREGDLCRLLGRLNVSG
jgi:hypothetical protein